MEKKVEITRYFIKYLFLSNLQGDLRTPVKDYSVTDFHLISNNIKNTQDI